MMCAECKAIASGDFDDPSKFAMTCPDGKIMKLVERSRMTGQEKYESDKERGEAEKIAQNKRDQAKAEEENAANSERTAKYLQGLAECGRALANQIRNL
jgi:hypothetical protein